MRRLDTADTVEHSLVASVARHHEQLARLRAYPWSARRHERYPPAVIGNPGYLGRHDTDAMRCADGLAGQCIEVDRPHVRNAVRFPVGNEHEPPS